MCTMINNNAYCGIFSNLRTCRVETCQWTEISNCISFHVVRNSIYKGKKKQSMCVFSTHIMDVWHSAEGGGGGGDVLHTYGVLLWIGICSFEATMKYYMSAPCIVYGAESK